MNTGSRPFGDYAHAKLYLKMIWPSSWRPTSLQPSAIVRDDFRLGCQRYRRVPACLQDIAGKGKQRAPDAASFIGGMDEQCGDRTVARILRPRSLGSRHPPPKPRSWSCRAAKPQARQSLATTTAPAGAILSRGKPDLQNPRMVSTGCLPHHQSSLLRRCSHGAGVGPWSTPSRRRHRSPIWASNGPTGAAASAGGRPPSFTSAPRVPNAFPDRSTVPVMTLQADLFEDASKPAPGWPEGMRYAPDIVTADEEQRLLALLSGLPFKEFEFHGFLGKRRTVSFGWRYDFNGDGLGQSDPVPEFLSGSRASGALRGPRPGRAGARPCHRVPGRRRHRLAPGPSGVRRCDRGFAARTLHPPPAAQTRAGKKAGAGWRIRGNVIPRQAPSGSGSLSPRPRARPICRARVVRDAWEHSIPPLDQLRYSVTFRTMADRVAARPRTKRDDGEKSRGRPNCH